MTEVEKLAADDPRAGTVDDPNVEDPYAHLRSLPKVSDGTAAPAEPQTDDDVEDLTGQP